MVEHCWEGCGCASRCINREMEQKGNFLQQRTGNAPALKHLTPEMIESRLDIGHLAVIAYAGAQAEGFSWIGSSASQLTRGRIRLWPPRHSNRDGPPHQRISAARALRRFHRSPAHPPTNGKLGCSHQRAESRCVHVGARSHTKAWSQYNEPLD